MDDHHRSPEDMREEIACLRERVSTLEGIVAQQSFEERKFRDIVENMQEGFLEVDLRGYLTFVNGAMTKILGYPREELLGMNYRHLMDEENARKVFQRYNEVYRTGTPIHGFPWQVIRKDGTRRDVEVSVSLIRDQEGKPTGFRGLLLDVTDKKRVLEDLQKSEELYRLLAEKMTDIVWIMDLNLRTHYVSPSVEKVLGYTVEERLQQDVREQLTPESLSLAFQRLAEEMDRDTVWEEPERNVVLELEFYHKDGSTRWLETIVSGIRDEQGRLLRLHGVSRDVTQRRHLEEELKESEQRWKFALEGAGDGVWDWNAQTNKVFYSRQWKAMLGYAEEE
ncbi:MAG: PAS domain S-box protein, partial [Syntrophales bacterium]|nr:PAS domain S-box protein [Syntrophales bacterium]